MGGGSPSPTTSSASSIINSVVPGAPKLTSSATNIIDQLLGGQPGTSTARNAAAYFGAGSGMPGSEFVANRGFDLYNRQGEQRQQKGIEDLLAMISGYTAPELHQREINQKGSQFAQSQAQQQHQFAASLAQQIAQMKQENSQFMATHPGAAINSGPSFHDTPSLIYNGGGSGGHTTTRYY